MSIQYKESVQAPLHKIDGLTLSLLTKEEVSKQSVTIKGIDKEVTYKESGDPETNGINDDLMGTMDKERLCKTCMGSQVECPGHFGHIALVRPVYHGNMLDYIRKVLRCVCFQCGTLLASDTQHNDELKNKQRIKTMKSRFNAVVKLSQSIKSCHACQRINHKYKKASLRIDYEINDVDEQARRQLVDRKQTLWPEEAKEILDRIKPDDLKMLGLDKVRSNPSNMIIENLAVAPPPVRPSVAMTNSMRSEDDLTVAYKQIIKQNNEIRKLLKNGNNEVSIQDARAVLQFFTASVMDNDIQGTATHKHKTGKAIKAIRARLKGKEGRLRGNLMGKRVDFSARTVITPDPNLKLDQLGVPEQIAMNLTVPEVVTEHNMSKLRNLVEKGAHNWPGAKYIKRSDGVYIDLEVLSNRTDAHLDVGYTVERHLMNDDYVIFNRQPSLHKMSLMGHRVKVLPFQTFRLNLSVTTPYNADFDGDEMNMHVPQSLETKAEIKEIMAVPRQIVAPQSNKPCMGIVQDSLLGVHRLTQRDTFLDKAAIMNLLMWINYDLEKGLPGPCIIKPKPLWSGKQVLSLIIPNSINLQTQSGPHTIHKDINDNTVVIQSGEIMQGIIQKKIVGNAAGGLIHVTWKDIDPYACNDLLSNIQLVVNNWLLTTGFTVGVQDIMAKPDIMRQVKDRIQKNKYKVRKLTNKTYRGALKSQPGKSTFESFEHQVNKLLNTARNDAGQIALKSLEKTNRLKNMVIAGSKGNDNNISQIMACVGQQNVEGKRIPFGFNKRSLPHFTKDDYGPESKGFVENSYVIGLTPYEFYFHAMGGREGLIDTAVKTADTGYISRRLMKALEDVMVKYDSTVRTSKELLIQFLYGEDGMAGEHFEKIKLDLCNMNNKDLEKKKNFLQGIQNEEVFQSQLEKVMGQDRTRDIMNDEEVQQMFRDEYEQLKEDRRVLREDIFKYAEQEMKESVPMPVNLPRIITNIRALNEIKPTTVSDIDPKHYFKQMKILQDKLCVIPQAGHGLEQESIIAEAHKNSTMLFKIFLRSYLCSKKIICEDRLDTISFDQVVKSVSEVFRSAIVHPGEMVGSIGAQSMGEPATQMTLNTFHSAGISSKNVTLGVPRLKEVINVAKTIKTPGLKIFMTPEIYSLPDAEKEKEVIRIGSSIQYTDLSNIISDWGIYYDPDPENTIIKEDEELIEIFNEFREDKQNEVGPWVLRFKIDDDPLKTIFDHHFDFERDIVQKFKDIWKDEVEVAASAELLKTQVIRMRPTVQMIGDDEPGSIVHNLRMLADFHLHDIRLRGFPNITKVSYTSNAADCTIQYYDQNTGEAKQSKGNWIIETDGCDLQNVFSVPGVDPTKTTSNHIIEILEVLGIEAARNALIRELRMILGTYEIYVNYRHLGTLVDVMTQRGIFTSITRHGINRVNSGPLRKCSFEETTEILLEAAFFGEHDTLTGITENVIFGQLSPYGTGFVDLIVDREALMGCLENGPGLGQKTFSPEYTPINEYNGDLTPVPDQTPGPAIYSGGGTQYTPGGYGDVMFTPNQNCIGTMSPGSSPSPYEQNQYSPKYQNQTPSYKTPAYYGTPVQGYTNSPAYSSSDFSAPGVHAAYSPGQASQHSAYSPTQVGPMAAYQSPLYSPTTPNYGSMTPIQHSSNTYQYGQSQGAAPSYTMPNVQSPSQSPANRAAQQPGGASYPSYGGGTYPASPSYNMSVNRPGTVGATRPGAAAYDPEARNSDSSESDEDK